MGSANNGEETVKAYAALRPDIVLMNVRMPKMMRNKVVRNGRRDVK